MLLHTEIDETTIPYDWILVAKVKISEDNYRFIFGSNVLSVINEFDKTNRNWLLDVGKDFKIVISTESLTKVVGNQSNISFHI